MQISSLIWTMEIEGEWRFELSDRKYIKICCNTLKQSIKFWKINHFSKIWATRGKGSSGEDKY